MFLGFGRVYVLGTIERYYIIPYYEHGLLYSSQLRTKKSSFLVGREHVTVL
jgi:hypothetical protein